MYSDIAQQYLQQQQVPPVQQGAAPTAQIQPVAPVQDPQVQAPLSTDPGVQTPQQKPEEKGGLGGIVGMIAGLF